MSTPLKRPRYTPESSTRTRIVRRKLHHKQDGVDLLPENPQDPTVASEALSRSLCIALHAVGFTSVRKTALESFQMLVEEYIHTFTMHVSISMEHSRRTTPLPHDFIHALAAMHLKSSSLEDDLEIDLNVPFDVIQPPVQQISASDFHPSSTFLEIPSTILPFLPTPKDDDLDPVTGQVVTPRQQSLSRRQRHVPSHFPLLPAAHAYRETPVFTARQNDARKIRERATTEGMEAEKALRKLVKASKSGFRRRPMGINDPKNAPIGSRASTLWANEEEMWLETLKDIDHDHTGLDNDLMALDDGTGSTQDDGSAEAERTTSKSAEEDEDATFSVNWERPYWRQGNRGAAVGVT